MSERPAAFISGANILVEGDWYHMADPVEQIGRSIDHVFVTTHRQTFDLAGLAIGRVFLDTTQFHQW